MSFHLLFGLYDQNQSLKSATGTDQQINGILSARSIKSCASFLRVTHFLELPLKAKNCGDEQMLILSQRGVLLLYATVLVGN